MPSTTNDWENNTWRPFESTMTQNDQLDIIDNWSFNNVTLQYYVCLTPVTSLSVEHLFNTPPYPLGVQLEGEKTYVKNHKTVFCRFFTLVCFFRQASCESRFWEVPQEPLSVVQRAESEFLDPPLFGVVYFKWVFSLPYLRGGRGWGIYIYVKRNMRLRFEVERL